MFFKSGEDFVGVDGGGGSWVVFIEVGGFVVCLDSFVLVIVNFGVF